MGRRVPGDFVVSRRVAGGCPDSGPPRSRPPFPSPQPSAAPASALTAAAASPAQPSCATVSKASRVPAVSTVSGALPGLGPWLRAGAQRVGVTLGGWACSGLHGGGPDSETPVLGGCLCSPSPRLPLRSCFLGVGWRVQTGSTGRGCWGVPGGLEPAAHLAGDSRVPNAGGGAHAGSCLRRLLRNRGTSLSEA